MSKLKAAIILQTAFGEYTVDKQLGEGGAGRVYGGVDDTGARIAIKVLTQASSDKKRRFKNEIAFLARNKHTNIVTVTDHGVASTGNIKGPFYVMRQYTGNLRELMRKSVPGDVMKLFSQILDGVEAAHLQGVTHRDLKPENVLFDNGNHALAIADFGIASFTDDQLVTLVETAPTQRLANFQYAAPEQRVAGKSVSTTADIYALGLLLNEMFTGDLPHGTDYRLIASVVTEYGYLDGIVSQMIKQNPAERPGSILEVKHLIQRHQAEAVSLQRLSKINEAVVRAGEIDEPLAHVAPVLIDAYWDNGLLRLTLDRPVTVEWVKALHNMGNCTSVMGAEPQRFQFSGATTSISVQEHEAQMVIDHFKVWLPQATRVLKQQLENRAREDEPRQREQLRKEREAEERRLRVNRYLRV
jgi:serine/threonine protein kinase